MPFGISSASEAFRHIMEQIFAGYPSAIIVDNILIGGKDIKDHDAILRKVLNWAREVNLRLNPEVQTEPSWTCVCKSRPIKNKGN